ncbi:MAG: peroxiredoxin family protein [Pyrinomonadaceae bacterium]
MRIISAILFVFICFGIVAGQNEIAPIVEKTFDFKDWTYKNVDTGNDVNLRKFASGKKLTLVVYWAPWCPNWKYDAAYVQGLYDKYKDKGLDIIGVAEYDPVEKMIAFIRDYKLTFTNVYESISTADREKTLHFSQRREAGDVRKWGSPWYVFLESSKLEPEGQIVLSKKTPIVNGELTRNDAEKFIRQRLGLETATSANVSSRSKEIEVCEPEKKTVSLKP